MPVHAARQPPHSGAGRRGSDGWRAIAYRGAEKEASPARQTHV